MERANTEFNNTGKISNGVGWTYHQNNHNPTNEVHNGRSEGDGNNAHLTPLKNHAAQNGNVENSPTSPQHQQHINHFRNHAIQHSSPQRNTSTSSHHSSGLVSPKPHTNAITPSFAGRLDFFQVFYFKFFLNINTND